MDRETAVMLLKKYNQEEFHLRHAVTVEAVMRYFAEKRGEDVEDHTVGSQTFNSSLPENQLTLCWEPSHPLLHTRLIVRTN